MYYNPFSNAIRRADQPGAPFRNTDNPDYVPALANPEALRQWLNDEVDLVSTNRHDRGRRDAERQPRRERRGLRPRLPVPRRARRRRPQRRRRRHREPLSRGRRPGLLGRRPVRALPLHQRPPALRGRSAGTAVLRRAGAGHRPPRGHPARRQLRVLQRGRAPREQLRPEGRLAHRRGREPALLARVPRLGADHLPDPVARRPEHQPPDDAGVDQRDRRLPGRRPLRTHGPPPGACLHLQRGHGAVPRGGRRGNRRLLALRLRERDRLDALRRHHEPLRQRRRGHPERGVAVHHLPRRGAPRTSRPRTAAWPRTSSASRSTW